MGIIGWIKSQDMFGHKIGLTLKGEDAYNTAIGGVFSIMININLNHFVPDCLDKNHNILHNHHTTQGAITLPNTKWATNSTNNTWLPNNTLEVLNSVDNPPLKTKICTDTIKWSNSIKIIRDNNSIKINLHQTMTVNREGRCSKCRKKSICIRSKWGSSMRRVQMNGK